MVAWTRNRIRPNYNTERVNKAFIKEEKKGQESKPHLLRLGMFQRKGRPAGYA